MPGVNGENVAQYINSSKTSIPVIFVTNHDDFVFSSFKYRPFGFLRKSHVDSELEEAVIRLDNYLSKSGQCYTFTFQGKLISLPYNKIKYIEAYGHEVVIHTTDTDMRTTRSLSETEKALSAYGFIRIHKSFIVNTRFIFSVERNNIILTDNNSLPVSRTKTEEIKQAKDELLITIISSLAQKENLSISENITWGQLKSFADGKTHLAYKHFHGYEKGEGSVRH